MERSRSERHYFARSLAILGIFALHAFALVALRPTPFSEHPPASETPPPLAITLITHVPLELSTETTLGSRPVTLSVPTINEIPSAELSFFQDDNALTTLAPYVRCALPEQLWREQAKYCEDMRAELVKLPVQPRVNEPDARMLAFAREAAERDAPKRLECVARRDKSTNWKCNSHSIWRDDAF